MFPLFFSLPLFCGFKLKIFSESSALGHSGREKGGLELLSYQEIMESIEFSIEWKTHGYLGRVEQLFLFPKKKKPPQPKYIQHPKFTVFFLISIQTIVQLASIHLPHSNFTEECITYFQIYTSSHYRKLLLCSNICSTSGARCSQPCLQAGLSLQTN